MVLWFDTILIFYGLENYRIYGDISAKYQEIISENQKMSTELSPIVSIKADVLIDFVM